jgi:hypothetical protein
MEDTKNPRAAQEEPKRTACPYCFADVDLHLDIKGRPYWRCWRCEIRVFGTLTALKNLQADGWIWQETRSVEEMKGWIRRFEERLGLTKRGRR